MTAVDLTCEAHGCNTPGAMWVPDTNDYSWWLCRRCAEECASAWAPPLPTFGWPWRLVALTGLILGVVLAVDGFRWIFISVELDTRLIWLHWLEGCCGAGAAIVGFCFLLQRHPT